MSPLASTHTALRNPSELPNEIIQQIFAIFATTLLTQRPAQFPWFLGHICSTWRYMFLSMTIEFWSSIWINLDLENAEHTIRVASFFLERDPAAPFSFNVSLYPHVRDHQKVADRLRQIMEMLVDESMRWKKASFNISAQDMLPLVRARDRLPVLQELILSRQSSYEGIPDFLYDVFQNAPSLNDVCIPDPANWKFNWLNLKAVEVWRLGSRASEFVIILPQMTKLERLELDCTYNDAIPTSTIFLPSLTTLSCTPGWLRFMQAPAMEDLLIDYEDASTFDSPDIVLSFLHRSCCALKILRLCILSVQASTVIEILRHTPQVAYLNLFDIIKPGNLFKQLIIPTNPAEEPLACQLISLFLRNLDDASDDDMDLLFDLISSRTVTRATGNCGYGRLQKFEIAGDMPHVSLFAKAKVITLCEERGVQSM